jgi:hypothetical protein
MESNDQIKKSFQKVKEDIDSLGKEIIFLRTSLTETREKIIEICDILKKIDDKTNSFFNEIQEQNKKKTLKTHNFNLIDSSTLRHINSTASTYTSTHKLPLEPLNTQNLTISTGNQGVPTDKQTNRQTDKQTIKPIENQSNQLENAAEMLDSLDSIKKEIRLKFKRLTDQEILVFSTLYQLEEEQGASDYKSISKKLKLSESSIRDYIGRLIKKGIPVDKKKINNKTIQLSISGNLKKIASLSTILHLRDL